MKQVSTLRSTTLSQAIAMVLGVASLGTALAQTISFDVPDEDAATSIPEFARQANLQIIAPADKLVGIKTHMLHGAMDVHAALKQLLEGTGLVIASDDGHTISLRYLESAEAHGNALTPAAAAGGEIEEVVVTATR